MKKSFEPNNAAYLLPAVLVSCCDKKGNDNIITIAWTTNICRTPPCVGFVISGEKYSAKLIKDTREFVLNIPGVESLKGLDICGETHGEIIDKFKHADFTKENAELVKPKLIKECPVNLECKLKEIFVIEDSQFFVGEVVMVHMDEKIINDNGKIDYLKLDPILYGDKTYWSIREKINQRGFSQKA